MSNSLMPEASEARSKSDTADKMAVVNEFKEMVESGVVKEFIITGVGDDGNLILASYCGSLSEGVGLLELGKISLINRQYSDE